MIKLITGRKGTGKTKQLIDMVNAALESTKGNVVCIEKGTKLTYDIKYTARLIDTDEYRIESFDAFYGFVAGLAAGNYDLTEVFVDGIFRICGRDADALGAMLEKIDALSAKNNVTYVFTISADFSELPDSVKKFL